MIAECDDQALLDRVRAGEEAALGELLARHQGDVRLAARRALGPLLRPHVDSMDLVQSVYRRVLSGLRAGRFRFDASLSSRAGLELLLRNAVRDRATVHRRRAARQGALLASAVASGRRSASGASADDHARDVALDDLMAHLAGFLNPTERRAVTLRVQGYSTTEAARELGIDPDLLRVQLHRMRSRLPAGFERLAESL